MSKVQDLVMKFEGERLKAYQDVAGKWTIGIGHLIGPSETYLKTAIITPQQSAALFDRDIKTAMDTIHQFVTVPLNENQTAALASLIFNIGAGNFSTSTLLKKLNAGDYAGAAAEFPKWRMAGGKVVPGLEARRAQEQSLFETAVA